MYYQNAKHERQVVNQLIDLYDQEDQYYIPPTNMISGQLKTIEYDTTAYPGEITPQKDQVEFFTPSYTTKSQFSINSSNKFDRTQSHKDKERKEKKQFTIFYNKKNSVNSVPPPEQDTNNIQGKHLPKKSKLMQYEYISNYFTEPYINHQNNKTQEHNFNIRLNMLKTPSKTESTERKTIDFKKIQVVNKPMLELGGQIILGKNKLNSLRCNENLHNTVLKDKALGQFVCQQSFIQRVLQKKLSQPKSLKNKSINNQTLSIHNNPVLLKSYNNMIRPTQKQQNSRSIYSQSQQVQIKDKFQRTFFFDTMTSTQKL